MTKNRYWRRFRWNLDTEDAWDPETQTVKQAYVGSHGETAADINLQLQMMRDHLENAFKYFEGNDIKVVKRYEERVNGVAPKRPAPEKQKQEKLEPKFYDTYQQFLIEAGDVCISIYCKDFITQNVY